MTPVGLAWVMDISTSWTWTHTQIHHEKTTNDTYTHHFQPFSLLFHLRGWGTKKEERSGEDFLSNRGHFLIGFENITRPD